MYLHLFVCIGVALRKESVDRNKALPGLLIGCINVALRKESVDRNARQKKIGRLLVASLSARRAWIEIRLADMSAAWNRSLSARRAWIEITVVGVLATLVTGRSPQGERG